MATKKKPAAKAAPAKTEAVEASPETAAPAAEPETDVVKVYELADKDTGFYDNETGFKIVRDQQKPLGETVGRATRTALVSGRLLVIGEK